MGIFRPYRRDDDTPEAGDKTDEKLANKEKRRPSAVAQDTRKESVEDVDEIDPADHVDSRDKVHQEKARPTKTRKQAEAERRARLHPNLSKRERKAREREARIENQQKLSAETEKSPTRVFLRDFVDNKWTISEFALPGMIVLFAVVLVFARNLLVASSTTMLAYLFMFMVIAELIWTWSQAKRHLRQRFPKEPRKGLGMYLIGRMIQIRRFRQPRPRITRGQIKDWKTWKVRL